MARKYQGQDYRDWKHRAQHEAARGDGYTAKSLYELGKPAATGAALHASHAPESLAGVLEGVEAARQGNDATSAVYAIWMRVCGESERRHTCGIYLDHKPKQKLPTLVVYVDSNSLMVEYGTDKVLYLARLEAAGAQVGDVVFKLSRHAVEHRARLRELDERSSAREVARGAKGAQASSNPASVSAEALSQVDAVAEAACAGITGELHDAVKGAMAASLRRDAGESAKNQNNA